MNILLIGSHGNIGMRYQAVLRYLGVSFDCYDTKIHDRVPHLPQFSHAIVATPIAPHVQWCIDLAKAGVKNILCEKPIAKDPKDIIELQKLQKEMMCDIRMVCNWQFVMRDCKLGVGQHQIFYDYYNTGADNEWDLIQPLFISNGQHVFRRNSPIFKCMIDGNSIDRKDFDYSYIAMLHHWLSGMDVLWNLEDALDATKKIISYMETEKIKTSQSKIGV